MAKQGDGFKELQSLWYAKLEKEGFEDIEDTRGPKRLLKEWHINLFRNNFNEIQYEATLAYYKNARRILRVYEFKNDLHRKIWELHCEGLTEREISTRIGVYKKSMIHYIIAQILCKAK